MTRPVVAQNKGDPFEQVEATQYQQLVLEHREAAHRLGRRLLGRFGIWLDQEEAFAFLTWHYTKQPHHTIGAMAHHY
ncbi:MAG: hypothetical protein EBZ48_15765 [Proteobacteria bacterium]|nr:hypothetical protein [Pseudomonadota bacterium]